ncbi:MAG: type II secretion system protein [Niabella sp.]|nr:type II secretion system protein [Niabella sp.]
MRNHKKYSTLTLPAFTLPELVVSLLLMAILFGIIATVYMIFSGQSRRSFETNRFFSEYSTTKKILQNDFEKARMIRFDTDGKSLLLQETDHKNNPVVVRYQLDSSYLIRTTGERADTLHPGGLLAGRTIVQDTLPLVTFIKLQHRWHGQVFYTYLQKNYALAELLTFDESTSTSH